MELKNKIIKRCCTTEDSESELFYIFNYFESKENNFCSFLNKIDKSEGLLVRNGVHNLLELFYPKTYQEFIKHIQTRMYIDKNKNFIRGRK